MCFQSHSSFIPLTVRQGVDCILSHQSLFFFFFHALATHTRSVVESCWAESTHVCSRSLHSPCWLPFPKGGGLSSNKVCLRRACSSIRGNRRRDRSRHRLELLNYSRRFITTGQIYICSICPPRSLGCMDLRGSCHVIQLNRHVDTLFVWD